MFMALVLSFLSRRRGFVWSPELDLTDREVYSTLLPFAHH
jgi:hypothetical protein